MSNQTHKEPRIIKDDEFQIENDIRLIRISRHVYSRLPSEISGNPSEVEIKCTHNSEEKDTSKDENQFFLFDYYDSLTHRKDNGSFTYEDIMGMRNTLHNNQNVTSSQLWSLVRIKNGSKHVSTPDPFLYDTRKNKEFLSDKPFLAMIMATIHPNTYVNWPREKNETELIKKCISSIEKTVRDFLKTKIDNPPLVRVFVSINYSDFCIVVRSSNFNDSFEISSLLREPSKKSGNIKFSTFTHMGIETGINADGYPSRLRIIENMKKQHVVLRLSLQADVIEQLLLYQNSNNDIKEQDRNPDIEIEKYEPFGVYGRYDISLRLNMVDFNVLYPLLCHHKLGIGKKPMLEDIIKEQPKVSKVVELLLKHLGKKNIHCVNERPLIHLEPITDIDAVKTQNTTEKPEGYNKTEPEDYIKNFFDSLKKLGNRIDALYFKAYELPFKRRIFNEEMRLVKDLYNTYSSMWIQHDSRINIWFFYVTIFILVSDIEIYIKKISQLTKGTHADHFNEAERQIFIEGLCDNVIHSIKESIQSINTFSKILQLNNLQTLQKPNYEIETHVDIEKYIIAVTEYLRSLSLSYFENMDLGCLLPVNRLMPIITMDLSVTGIEQRLLFNYMNYPGIHNGNDNVSLIKIIIPTFEILARTYDLLPLLSHEICHCFRFLKREKRNDFVISLINKRASEYIARQWISMSIDKHEFVEIDSVIELVSKAIFNAFKKNLPIYEWSEYPLEYLKTEYIDFFLKIFINNDDFLKTNPNIKVSDSARESLKFIYSAAYGVQEKNEEIKSDYLKARSSYISLLKELDEKTILVIPENEVKLLQNILKQSEKMNSNIASKKIYKNIIKCKSEISVSICDMDILISILKISGSMSWKESLCKLLQENGLYMNSQDLICVSPERISGCADNLWELSRSNILYEFEEYFRMDDLSPYVILGKLDCEGQNRKIIADFNSSIEELYTKMVRTCEEYELEHQAEYERNLKEIVYKLSNKLNEVETYIAENNECFFTIDDTTSEALHLSIDIFHNKIQSYIQSVFNIDYHLKNLNRIASSNPKGIPICSNHLREQVIKDIHDQLRLSVLYLDKDNSIKKTIASSSEIYTLLNSLSITSSDERKFNDNILRCFVGMGNQRAIDLVEKSVDYYREVAADLGMCVVLSLNAFGYLKFYACYHHRENIKDDDQTKDMRVERTAAVILTLMSAQNDTKEKNTISTIRELDKNIHDYIDKLFKATIEDIKKDLCIKDRKEPIAWAKFTDKMSNIKDSLKDVSKNPADFFRDLVDFFHCEFSNIKANHLEVVINKYFERFDRLAYMINLYYRVRKEIPVVDIKTISHLVEMFPVIKKLKGDKTSEYVGAYFNSIDQYGDTENRTNPFNPNNMLKVNFQFILKYYYKNRLAYSHNPTFDQEWIKELTGGHRG